jgi:beta-glucanase (GH16 family)
VDPDRLAWADDFDGPAGQEPDRRRWRPEVGPGVNGELQYYTDNGNARLDGGGHLVLSARREATPGAPCPRDPVSGSTVCQYTSGRLNTSGLFAFTYGRVEARIRVSGTPGLWPAFWMLGADMYTGQAPWPNCGEIDVMEHLGRTPGEVSSTLHAAAFHGTQAIGQAFRAQTDFAAGFHTYGADWRPDRIIFSVDGRPFFTADRATVEKTRGPWPFDRPFVLLLNNAVGGPYPGPPGPDTRLPQDMVVDYVRVYR